MIIRNIISSRNFTCFAKFSECQVKISLFIGRQFSVVNSPKDSAGSDLLKSKISYRD